MTAFGANGRSIAANINNHLKTKTDPKEKFSKLP
jgi:hypothetical protein